MKNSKILFLNYEFPPIGGGGSYVSYEIAKNLASRGASIDVVTMSYKGLPKYEQKDGMRIYRVPCIRRKAESCNPLEQLTYVYSTRKFLKKHLKENNYDICHAHFIIPTGFVTSWLYEKYGLEYILTSHGSDVLGYNRRFAFVYPFVESRWVDIVKKAKCITTPSQFLLEQIEEFVPEAKLKVIPNGIEKKKFVPMKKEKIMLVVARLFKNKGIQDILDALRDLELGDWKVKIVGDGPYRSELEAKMRENSLEEKVEFLGWLDNDSKELKELYGKSSIFLSASWFESFGLTVLEALQAECYVLVSDNLGYRQLDLDSKHYFETQNPQDLHDTLKEVLASDEVRGEKFDSRYEWPNVIKEYEEVLK